MNHDGAIVNIPGYSGFLWLYDDFVARAPREAVIVEVGVALGHSVAHLARRCIDHGRSDVTIYAVDPWGGYARNGEQQEALGDVHDGDFGLFLRAMLEHAPRELERIRVVRETSYVAARMFRQTLDLVMIDAAHDEASVADDLETWAPLVREGGTLAGDDFDPKYPGVERAVRARFGDRAEVRGTTWSVRL